MSSHQAYVRIDGEPFLSRATAYREQRNSSLQAWSGLAKELGATSIPEHLAGLNFGHTASPAGWTKPKGRNGYSSPKKGSPDADRLAVLRERFPMPDARTIFGDTLCEGMSYEGPDCRGGTSIGHMFGPSIGWAGDTFFAVVPDAEAAVGGHLAANPSHRITNGADAWRMPSGLTRLTKAEYELAFAQYAVEEERRAAQEAAPLPSPALVLEA